MRRPYWVCLLLAACSGPDANLQSPDPYERFLGVRELEGRKDAAGLSEIVKRLADPHYLVVAGAITTLAEMEDPAFLQHIAPLVQHAHPIVRRRACEGIGRLRNPLGVPFLLKAAEDPDPQVRRGAVHGLEAFKDAPDARRGLVAAVGDKDPGVSLVAHETLQRITGRDDVPRTREAWAEILK
ncbi:MAG TPA: HEAT repeat domain-containing protein [Planctomycetota bacterium]